MRARFAARGDTDPYAWKNLTLGQSKGAGHLVRQINGLAHPLAVIRDDVPNEQDIDGHDYDKWTHNLEGKATAVKSL